MLNYVKTGDFMKKNNKWRKPRHKVIYTLLRPLFLLYFKLKYKCKFPKPLKIKGGCIILCNHVTTLDPFMVGAMVKGANYFMASMDLFQHKFVGKLIKWLVNPIPKQKSKSSDLAAVKTCMKVARENGNVVIFPEGNRTLTGKLGHVEPSIVKLVKALKKPLVILNIEGGFGTDPRWSNKIRKGKMRLSIKSVTPYEEIKDMENDALYKFIIDGITVDDLNFYNNYKGKKRAEFLERVFYKCPVCNEYHKITTKKHTVYCTNCGLEVLYGEDLRFTSNKEEFKFDTISDWYDWQIEEIKNSSYADDELIYSDNIKVFEPILWKKKRPIGEGKMSLYGDYFIFDLGENKIKINFDEIEAVTILGKKKMNIYAHDMTYQVFNDNTLNCLKYMHTYYIIKNRKVGKENEFIGI